MIWRRSIAAILPFVALTGSLAAQSPPADLALERSEYAEWLAKAPNSPLAAVAQQPIGPGIRLGPTDADVPLAGVAEHRVTERGGAVTLEGPQGARPLPVGRPIALGEFFVTSAGLPGRRVLTVFGRKRGDKTAEYIDRILTRLTFGGAVYLAAISILPVILISGLQLGRLPWIGESLDAIMPEFLSQGLNVKFYFGGTSLLIVVGVAMDTVQQIESQLIMRHYEGFMKGARIRGRRG